MFEKNFPASLKNEILFSKEITEGSSGMGPRRVQEWLSFHGCATSIDGKFGTATVQAVCKFQKAKAFAQTGKVDQETWDALIDPLRESVVDGSGDTLGGRIISVASNHLASRPVELGGANRGPWVRCYMEGHDGTEWLWCAGFVTFLLRQACVELGCPMPIKGSLSCDTLAAQAQSAGLFVTERELKTGQKNWTDLGEAFLFVVRRTPGDWQHTGIGHGGSADAFSTIEGNTNDVGGSNGYEVCARTRSAISKDFICLR